MNRKESKVFVTQYSNHLNFQKAEQYGAVTFLSEKEYRSEPAMADANDRVRDEILTGLADYIPGIDYILLTGSPIPTMIAGILIGRRMGASHNILKWNNQSKTYELVKIRM